MSLLLFFFCFFCLFGFFFGLVGVFVVVVVLFCFVLFCIYFSSTRLPLPVSLLVCGWLTGWLVVQLFMCVA